MMPASCCSRCAVLYAAEACRSSRWRSSGVRSRIPWSNGVGLGCRLHLRLGWIRSGGSSCRMTPCEKSSGLPVSSSMSSGLGESGGYKLRSLTGRYPGVGTLLGFGCDVDVFFFFILGFFFFVFRHGVVRGKCDTLVLVFVGFGVDGCFSSGSDDRDWVQSLGVVRCSRVREGAGRSFFPSLGFRFDFGLCRPWRCV